MSLKFFLFHLIKHEFYREFNRHLREMQQGDPNLLAQRELDRVLAFARKNNPYYKKLLSEGKKLHELPILTKEIIRGSFDDMKSTGVSARTYLNSSGGSTGKPQTFLQDSTYASWSEASQEYYFREFLNTDRNGVKNVWLWGSERDTFKMSSWKSKVALWLRNKLILNTFNVTKEKWLEYIERIKSFRPYYVAGYAGSLYQISRVARKHNIRLYQPRFVYSAAEMLRDFMRQEIEEQFNTKVFDYYGSREVGAIAGECRAGKRHILVMNNLVEIMDANNRPLADGQEGKIIVTNLHNYSMPLIRYEIGDTGSICHSPCACGSPLPYFESLAGRITDHFLLKNGDMVHGEFFTHLFYFVEWIDQFQVNQVDYYKINIKIVQRGEPVEADVQSINDKIKVVMGKNCQVHWEYVDSIEKTQQGKYLYTQCLVGK